MTAALIASTSPLFEATMECARPMLADAVGDGFHTVAGIEQTIRKGTAQLWVGAGCIVVTEVQSYLGGAKVLQFMWAAGDLEACLAATPDIEAWGRRIGCTTSLVESRPAWAKLLKPLGYTPWSVTVQKAL